MPAAIFDPSAVARFRFTGRSLQDDGTVRLGYALDDLAFEEVVEVPVPAPLDDTTRDRVAGIVALLHWCAGVSYFKAAAPPAVAFDGDAPPPATAALLEALYSEGLGEFAYRAQLASLPRPAFPTGPPPSHAGGTRPDGVLVPVGGGKDSVVALEAVRRSGRPTVLFSVGDADPIRRSAEVAGLKRLVARRRIDPALIALNDAGALNGHVPVTAIVSCIAVLTASLNGLGAVAMANERSASTGNLEWDGVVVNHQFSKGRRAELLLRAALAEVGDGTDWFSLLRPVSELAITRAFAALPAYHHAFTSCNTVFRLDASRRGTGWCGACPKCRFVFLALAPFCAPAHLAEVFGADLLDDPDQYEGFALLAASGGHKPFECVGEEEETVSALRLLADDERWRDHVVVRRAAAEILPEAPAPTADPFALAGDHDVPADLLEALRAVLGP